jgi:glycosyltransferase involved in cell wall biosynthesis
MGAAVSIIIPTSGKRPVLLARAMNSAESSEYEVEIILVVNGPEAENFQLPDHHFPGLVHIIRIKTAGVSNARNIGLDAATGRLTRFLDDDDYLVPDAARRQYEYALASGADVVSFKIRIEDDDGNSYGESVDLNKDDPYCDLLSACMFVFTPAHVYKTSAIKTLRWDVSISNAEDVDWLHRVARDKEQKWLTYNEVVAVWFQHLDNDRLSFASINNHGIVVSSEAIIATYNLLKSCDRLNRKRELAVALGLWKCAHQAFYLSPFYWTKIVKKSIALDKNVTMVSNIYRWASVMHIPVLLIDWAMIPKRYINHFSRAMIRFFRRTSHIRRF